MLRPQSDELVLKEASGAQLEGRDAGLAGTQRSPSVALTYIRMCDEIGNVLDQTKLECHNGHTMSDVRMCQCQNCRSLWGLTTQTKHGIKRLVESVALRAGFF